jgi:hypothetical protein
LVAQQVGFQAELVGVGQMLVMAAAAGRVMWAFGGDAFGGGFDDFEQFGTGEVFALFDDAGADDFAGQGKGDKDGASIVASDGFAAVGLGGQGELDGFWGHGVLINITLRCCIAAAHSLLAITEKWLCVGVYAPTHNHFSRLSSNFAL